MRTLTIHYTASRPCPNCEGRGDDGAAWRPFACRRCGGRGALVTGVRILDSEGGSMPPAAYDFNERGEVFLLDFDENEAFEVIRPADPAG